MSVNSSDLRRIPTLKVDNLWKWVEYVCDVKRPGSTWIFRGQACAEWYIKSSFERMWYDSIDKTDSETKRVLPAEIIEKRLRTKECGLIDGFVRDAWHFVENDRMTTVERLAEMRHHDVPTRMVDFSDSALVALYFALEDENETGDFAVWCVRRGLLMDAYCCNKNMRQRSLDLGIAAMQRLNRPDGRCLDNGSRKRYGIHTNTIEAIRRNDQFASDILDDDIDNPKWVSDELPIVYVYPKRRNARMGVQGGLFLMQTRLNETFMEALLRACRICDSKDLPMVSLTDVMSGKETFGSVKLVRFVFSAGLRCEARALLSAANISPRTMYPDLEGVARSLKGDCGLG